jgi:hypothetical protein
VKTKRLDRITVDPSDTKTIRKLVAEGIASGRAKPAEEVFERLIAKYDAMAKANKSRAKPGR